MSFISVSISSTDIARELASSENFFAETLNEIAWRFDDSDFAPNERWLKAFLQDLDDNGRSFLLSIATAANEEGEAA